MPSKRRKRERYFGQPLDCGHDYRPKFVCFDCRKVIRVARRPRHNQPLACGHCGGPIYPVGPMFKPPKAKIAWGKRAWAAIKKGYPVRTAFFARQRWASHKMAETAPEWAAPRLYERLKDLNDAP